MHSCRAVPSVGGSLQITESEGMEWVAAEHKCWEGAGNEQVGQGWTGRGATAFSGAGGGGGAGGGLRHAPVGALGSARGLARGNAAA